MLENNMNTTGVSGLSSCCGAYMKTGGDGNTHFYYVCTKCGCVCDTGLSSTEKPDRFVEFKKYFLTYQKLFGLNGYKIYFKEESLDDDFADILINQAGMVVTVRFNASLSGEDKPFQDIHSNAKHEALHLLLGRLSGLAQYRYATKADVCEAEEELVRRLETLIPDEEK
uniref:Uncharacterized protein n=2 Tax=viral metagenome TaxID=1070528 RepID=A0A6M3J8V3_9ZZZZ